MIFLLANWRWLIPSVIALGLGLTLGVTKFELNSARTELAQVDVKLASQKAEAATLLEKANAESAAKDTQLAEFANQLDTEHAQATEAIKSMHDQFAAQFSDQLRQLQRCRTGSLTNLPTSPVNPGKPPTDTPRGNDGFPERIGSRLASTGVKANLLAETVRECVKWAHEIGR